MVLLNPMMTRFMIREWLECGKGEDATHMFVICDTYSWEDYPVYVFFEDCIGEVAARYDHVNMQKIMECYDLAANWDIQLTEQRSWNGWRPVIK